jgi:hypothetical protein
MWEFLLCFGGNNWIEYLELMLATREEVYDAFTKHSILFYNQKRLCAHSLAHLKPIIYGIFLAVIK